jgi:hypothetical protein
MRTPLLSSHDPNVGPQPRLYIVRIAGRLGPTVLSAFPSMVHEVRASETVLTGLLHDRSAVFSLIAEVEALGLELLELRQVQNRPTEPR